FLADAGLEVFIFGNPDSPLNKKLAHPNIHCFENSEATGIRGSLGDFHVYVKYNGFSQVIQAGTVILGEKARRRVPYIPQEGQPGQFIVPALQKKGITGVPFRLPGTTAIAGLFLANPPGLHVSDKKKGAAAAALAAAVMPRGPRQNKGYTVRVDEPRCRGCGRCINVCPYKAVTFRRTDIGGWCAVVDEALCKGCGNCISVCPSNAADSRYRDLRYMDRMIEEVLLQ
ncbi:MAG: 4Fe-4S binding protein, partial [Deltaproteobacteria bacterium]|nr:4Fe-4S binding protein [Deltaproteobacteria bacterium]